MPTTATTFARADSIQVGDALVEGDGYLWGIVQVVPQGGNVRLTGVNEFSPDRTSRVTGRHFTARGDLEVAVIRGGGAVVAAQALAAQAEVGG